MSNKIRPLYFLLVIILILLIFLPERESVNIGVFKENADAIETYLNQQINGVKIEVTDLSSMIENDPFEDTMKVIYNVLKNNEIDMLLNIEPDYLISQKDQSIFLNLESVNMEFLDPCIKNYVKFIEYEGNRFYIPSSIDNCKFLLINNSILKKYGMEIPEQALSMEQLFLAVTDLSEKLDGNTDKIYPISYGSPVDEYFFDDLDKLLLEYRYPAIQMGQYSKSYTAIAKHAKTYSYTRNDIGHTYPLDYYFCSGKVAYKIATLYELMQFKASHEDSRYAVKNFEYSIHPIPYMNDAQQFTNAQLTLMCVSDNTEKKTACFKIIDFMLSKQNALNTVKGINPTTMNIASAPIYDDDEINKIVAERYGTDQLLYGDNFLVHSFVKNRKTYWSMVEEKRMILMDYLQNNISEAELFHGMNFIIEEYDHE